MMLLTKFNLTLDIISIFISFHFTSFTIMMTPRMSGLIWTFYYICIHSFLIVVPSGLFNLDESLEYCQYGSVYIWKRVVQVKFWQSFINLFFLSFQCPPIHPIRSNKILPTSTSTI